MELLKIRLPKVLHTDSHSDATGGYFIRSVYFEDVDFTAYREKLHGVEKRTKYRLRWYNFDDSFILLEKKMKDGEMTGKLSARVSRAEAESLLSGENLSWASRNDLLREFARLRRQTHRPAVVVDYDRCAYTWPVEDVRVTLDQNIRTCPYRPELFEPWLLTIPVMDPGEQVLEVKYNAFLPAHVAMLIEDVPKQRSSVSKFVHCLSLLE